MIQIRKKIIFSLLLAATFVACNDDKSPVYDLSTTPQIEPLVTPVFRLNEQAADFIAETFSWTKGSYGFTAAPTYVLQVDNNKEFLDPIILAESYRPYASVTVGKLNVATLILGGKPNTLIELYARLEASLTPSVKVYSDPIDFQVIPYDQEIDFPELYVAGSFQGWNPSEAPAIVSLRMNRKYEGYLNLVDAGNPASAISFKILGQKAWGGLEYGSGGAPGTLAEKGGDISVSPQGYYLLKVDLNTMTYTPVLVNTVSLSGSALAAEKPLVPDYENSVWKSESVDLAPGTFRVLVNGGAAASYGDGDGDFVFDQLPGNDIQVTEAGNYKITIYFEVAPYQYELVKN